MNRRDIPIIKEYAKRHKKRSKRHRVIMAVAVLVVFCTTYAMILPAITMENKNKCKQEEHFHQSACYGTQKVLACQQEVGKIHSHNENCYAASGELVCRIDTTVEHTHTVECYISKMVMVCGKAMHQHTENCSSSSQNGDVQVTPTENVTEVTTEAPTVVENAEINKDSNKADIKSETTETESATEVTDLVEYLKKRTRETGEEHTVEHFISDYKGDDVPDLTAVQGNDFYVTLKINAPKGIHPGKYQYKLPIQVQLLGSEVSDYVQRTDIDTGENANVGMYSVTKQAQVVITLDFTDEMNNYEDFYGEIGFDIGIDNGGEEPVNTAVTKNGSFNESTGMFEFEIVTTVPSFKGSDYFQRWNISDNSFIDVNNMWNQDLSEATVEVTYNQADENGQITTITRPLPEITETTKNDKIAYVSHAGRLYLVNRCKCNEALCGNHSDISDEDTSDEDTSDEVFKCKKIYEQFDNEAYDTYTDWCTCWNSLINHSISVKYQNNKNLGASDYGADLLKNYTGDIYTNYAQLMDEENNTKTTTFVEVDIPKLITKSANNKNDFSISTDYSGVFTIKANESKLNLKNVNFAPFDSTKVDITKIDMSLFDKPVTSAVDGTTSSGDGIPDGLFIQDKMKNASFIPNSMQIVATGAQGEGAEESIVLKRGVDYEIQFVPGSTKLNTPYEGTLNILILNTSQYFGKYMYTIQYKVQAITDVKDNKNQVKISNNATVSIYSYPVDQASRTCNINKNWKYRQFKLTVEKIDSIDPNIKLANAVFGLYTEDGYEMARAETGPDGLLNFSTNVRKGVFFDPGELYFVQEIDAPEGYSLNSMENWFYFSDTQMEGVDLSNPGIMFCSIDDSEQNVIQCVNEKKLTLPETGGCGTVIYPLAGSVMILGSAYALYKKFSRRKGGQK
ncbi:MAG: SpaA isopeptide-forming pilin-related protein [Acutalibacteraceae bacterium]|nr:SpaA isopeptide-forming pilin-related protein [Acutalibacteraceae bacterium]